MRQLMESRHVVRSGLVAWGFAAMLVVLGLATFMGAVDTGQGGLFGAFGLGMSVLVVVRVFVGGVWVDRHGCLVVRDWLRTRTYRVDHDLVIGYVPYDGFVSYNAGESRMWATLTFTDGRGRARACRLTVAGFGTTKRRVKDLREQLGLPAGPGRLE
ncbi:hypothetical protein RN607_05035 [Demequina capsici]|uniref:PH domain-containing protein n=1 Tax=Demequina capsici TaxID=3075620 RepID=A0AA96FF38_9MICO|nr:hypothetical protein [Demequina sp. PMTSA13]WNM28369.1 hypothetical protein RN607_05035 [Demequina sp. PMTSA13]